MIQTKFSQSKLKYFFEKNSSKYSSIFIDVKGKETTTKFNEEISQFKRKSYVNNAEVKTIRRILENYQTLDMKRVAILSFYTGQMLALQQELETQFPDVSIRSVDSFQGNERDIIILSFVRTKNVGFLNCDNRLNVAMKRAKNLLIMVGDYNFICSSDSRALKGIGKITKD